MLKVSLQHAYRGFELAAAFSAETNSITALFGKSGSGKTTIINQLAGLERPAAGRIELDGDVLFDSAANIHVAPEHRRFGYVFQDGRLFPHMTVRGNLTYGKNKDSEIDFDQIADHRVLSVPLLLRR